MFIQMDRALFWVGIRTESVNLVSGIAILSGIPNPASNWRPGLVNSRSSYPVRSTTASALLGKPAGTLAYDSDSGVDLLSSTTYVDLLVIRMPT